MCPFYSLQLLLKSLLTELELLDCIEIRSPNIDEKAIRDSNPKLLVTMLASAKAEALVHDLRKEHEQLRRETLLTTGDQVWLL